MLEIIPWCRRCTILFILATFLPFGCAQTVKKPEKPPVVMKYFKSDAKCKVIGRYRSERVVVVVGRGCGGIKETTVTFVLLKRPYLASIDDGIKHMIDILGYKPHLMPFFNNVLPPKYGNTPYVVCTYLILGKSHGKTQ